MTIDGHVLAELTQAAWQSYVDADLPLLDLYSTPPVVDGDGMVVGCIDIHGPVAAQLRVALPRQAASAAAARMFDVDLAQVAAADVEDAAGELTNIIGGNVKARLEGEHRLGLPSVVAADRPDLARGAIASATLLWGEHVLLVTLDTAPGGTP